MAEHDSSEKTEKPSPYKIREARKKGSVSKSLEFNSFCMIVFALLIVVAAGDSFILRTFELCQRIFTDMNKVSYETGELVKWFNYISFEGLSILGGFAAMMMVVGILSTIIQTGPNISFFPLKPDIKKINPVEGIKRLFSIKSLIELVKSLVKLSCFGLVLYLLLDSIIPELMMLFQIAPQGYIEAFKGFGVKLVLQLSAVVLIVALIDLLFTRWDYIKKLRMSKHEVKEERKRFDGDPQIKQKRKELEKELRKRTESLQNVPGSDVVISNPTHLAIALKYDREEMISPKVVAKGSDVFAQKIKETARQHRIPIIENKPLARQLYKRVNIDNYINEDCYIEVAKILRKVYQQKAI